MPARFLTSLVMSASFVLVLCRFGTLSAAVLTFTVVPLSSLPLCVVPASWLTGLSLLNLLMVAAVAAWGLVVSLGGRVLPADEPT